MAKHIFQALLLFISAGAPFLVLIGDMWLSSDKSVYSSDSVWPPNLSFYEDQFPLHIIKVNIISKDGRVLRRNQRRT